MEIVTKEVEVLIKTKLPNRFVPVIDDWSKSSIHFVGVFASYSCENNLGYESALLSFSPLLTETSFNARDHYEYLERALGLYIKKFENVVCICGDNAEVNKAIANLSNLPLLGCNSHRMNLTVKEFTKTSSHLLEKLNNLMIKLRGLKLSGKLRKLTHLQLVYKNDTRWLNVYEMFDRYCKLCPFLVGSSFAMEQVVMDYLPTAREHAGLLALLEPMMKLKSVTLALQRDNITIADVNCLFEKVTSEFPCTIKYLDPMAPIVHSRVFESAVCKWQNGQQSDLTEGEKGEISNLLIQSVSQPENVRIVNEEEDFVSSIIKKRRQECETKSPDRMYIDTRFLPPTSNILERFFSTANITYSDIRQRLLSQNLEMQLSLKLNKKFWTLDVVEKCVTSVDTWIYPFAGYLFSTLRYLQLIAIINF